MDKNTGKDIDPLDPASLAPEDFLATLTPEDKLVIHLRDELYEGNWDLMEQDLRQRLDGKAYIFRLAGKIEADLARIARLRAYESIHQIELRQWIVK